MTREEAIALGQFVRETKNRPDADVQILHKATAVAMRYPDSAPRCLDVDAFQLSWQETFGVIAENKYVWITTDVRDIETLRHVLQHAIRPAPESIDPDEIEERATWDKIYQPHTYTYLPSKLWHSTTAAAVDTQRGAMLARLLDPLAGTEWRGAGTVAASEIGFCVFTGAMKNIHWDEATDSEISLTVRSADGTATGWSGHAHRDWNQLAPERVAREAIAVAKQQLHPTRAEPGRYTAILSATAVGQFLQQMAGSFNVAAASPFSVRGVPLGGRDRRGQRVFDPRITLVTDPSDPEGGDFPFFPDGLAYPSGKATWVEQGVLKQRSVSVSNGLTLGMTPLRNPDCVRMTGGPTSVEEMIAQCERGMYVHRFSSLSSADLWSGTMDGFTRGGCLLIMNGKIKGPVKDFRFYESPFLAFNRVLALGTPQRVAFGFTPRVATAWPYSPVIAPPMMVRDFNFSALADNA